MSPDVIFLRALAKRIQDACYYDKVGPIGLNGSVSPGLSYDDMDRLREMANQVEMESLEARLTELRTKQKAAS